MNIVVCDDNTVFAEALVREIRRYAGIKDICIKIKKYQLPEHFLAENISEYDAVFLDIEMPQINGLDVARQLRKKYPELVIVFITSFIEYAPAGYRVNAFRYLLKKNLSEELWPCLDEIQEKIHEDSKMLTLHTKERTVEVAVKNVLYFEGTAKRIVLAHLEQSNEAISCIGKLADYDEQLAELGFLRIQKSYLVNMDNIIKIKNYMAVLRDGTELKVSERQYSEVCKKFLMWRSRVL